MRQQVTLLGIAPAILLFSPALAADRSISYVESSVGLKPPTWEGGNSELDFGDINGDGHVDLISVGDHGNPGFGGTQHGIMVWFGDGAGGWTFFQTGDLGYGGVALADVNHDGLMDVGYGIHHNYSGVDLGDQILEVALGDGTGMNWTPWDDGLATAGEDWGMFGCDFADVDNDGDLDLGSISFGCCAGLHVYLNNEDGTWTHGWGFVGGNSSMLFEFGDVNGDGYPDFAAAHGNGTVYINDGEGNFTLADGDLPGSDWRRGTSLGDVNGDGRDDLSFTTSSGAAVYTLESPGHWVNLSGSLATIGDSDFTEIADMNLDGHGDIVVRFDSKIAVYLGDGAGNWQEEISLTTAEACDEAALRAGTDVDHNGYPDFAYLAEEDCGMWTGGTNTLHFFKESSVPTDAFVYPKYPRGGEAWFAGSVRFIDWNAAVPTSSGQPKMSIEISTGGPDGVFKPVAAEVPNNGRYQWLVSSDLPSSDDCYLRFTLGTQPPVVKVTPAAFTIVNPFGIPGDVDGDGVVDVLDLIAVLSAWGPCPPPPDECPADVNGDGTVDVLDLLVVLSNWS